MTDLHKALAQINAIRGQIARGTEFRGYGPATLAATGGLALLAALLQAAWVTAPERNISAYLAIWISTAIVSLIIISIETVTRARRIHSAFAMQMLQSAVEQFLPAICAGFLLTIVLILFAQHSLWILPGAWQIIFSLGVFSSCRFLPRRMFIVGIWYLATGLICLSLADATHAFAPWTMGIPFCLGQLAVAAVLHFDGRDTDG